MSHNTESLLEQYQRMFNEMLDGFALHEIICDPAGNPVDYRFLDINPAFTNLTGLPRDIVGKTVLEALPGTEQFWIDTYGKVALTGEPAYFENYSAELKKYFEVKAYQPVHGQFACIFVDCTRRKEAELELRKSRDSMNRLIAGIPDIVMRFDRTFRHLYTSENVQKLSSLQASDFLGKTHRELGFPEAMCSFWESNIAEVFASKKAKETEFTLDNAEKERYINWRIIPELNDDGTVETVLSFSRDITAHRQLEQKLLQSEKMKAIGQLAGGIAHDFNNLLGGIIGFTDMAIDSVSPDNEVASYLQHILNASNRAKKLVRQILSFSRQGNEIKKAIFLSPIINEAVTLLRAIIPASITIEMDVHKDTQTILADATKIHEIVMNLCTNAAQAIANESGTIHISHKERHIQKKLKGYMGSLMPGFYSILSVKDTGFGIPKSILPHIFEPFYTTREVGQGTGMGLAVVYGIVESLQGNISVTGAPGKGTQIHVYLPKSNTPEQPAAQAHASEKGGTEHIVFVDDEPFLVDMGVTMLTKMGYTVSGFCDSQKALEAFKKSPQAYDILVTDQTMPHLNGTELIREIRKIKPGIPTILTTGYSTQVDKEKAKRKGIHAFIMKPLRKTLLTSTVRSVLDKSKT